MCMTQSQSEMTLKKTITNTATTDRQTHTHKQTHLLTPSLKNSELKT